MITDEIFYDQTNTLFLYRSAKNISIEIGVLPETEKVKDETNFNKIKQNMEFSLLLKKGNKKLMKIIIRYGEKEIREIKKNNNFGEIEMCLNEKLSFNIKIKSRNCELFVCFKEKWFFEFKSQFERIYRKLLTQKFNEVFKIQRK